MSLLGYRPDSVFLARVEPLGEVLGPEDGTDLDFRLPRSDDSFDAERLAAAMLNPHLELATPRWVPRVRLMRRVPPGRESFPAKVRVLTPEGSFEVLVGTEEREVRRIYNDRLGKAYDARRVAPLREAMALWLLPLAALYGLAGATVWVYRGFKSD